MAQKFQYHHIYIHLATPQQTPTHTETPTYIQTPTYKQTHAPHTT